ncbi:MAG: hypothetical protein COB07_06190 [Sulfurovum sp.]|nr:MAG: hypothetical protein COB07_06190 [Sulfurovum sp.]
MQSAAKEEKRSLIQTIESFLSFTLSDKLKFAIKASLSIALAYLIPFSQGWSHATSAFTTVMLIAAMGSVGDSVMKGLLRVIGTVLGASLGLTLIALFPQDRVTYLLLASVIVTVLLYFARAYKGDTTVFLLSAITLLMMFDKGEVENVFIYGIDKTYMTIFGIMIYTLVGIFLWPINLKDTSAQNAVTLSEIQAKLYLERDGKNDERKELQKQMITQEQLLGSSIIASDSSSNEMNFSKTQWYDIVHSYKKVDQLLMLLSHYDKASYSDDLTRYIPNYHTLDREISALLKALPLAWKKQKEIDIPQTFKLEYQLSEIKELSQLDRAELSTTMADMVKLHRQLCKLSEKLNSLISPMPTLFTLEDIPSPATFLWFDMEHLKGSLVTFMVFWTATLLWIFVNPPGGFMIVTLATGLSLLTTFTPVKPSLLIIIFSMSFVFATAMYVFVLPHLHYGWELGLFVAIYAFIGFYLINPKMSIFFMLGIATLGINNTMNYNFNVFLITLFTFYAFLFILLFFYYIPFSTKPEHLFLLMKKRFFKLAQILLQRNRNLDDKKRTLIGSMAAKYSKIHLMSTVKNMQLWASQIDDKYFDTLDKNMLLAFSKECETFVYLLEMLVKEDDEVRANPLIKAFREKYSENALAELLGEYAEDKEVKDIDPLWKSEEMISTKIEDGLKHFLFDVKYAEYSEKEIIEFYENISLRRNVWLSLLSCQTMMEKLDFKVLERSRF